MVALSKADRVISSIGVRNSSRGKSSIGLVGFIRRMVKSKNKSQEGSIRRS